MKKILYTSLFAACAAMGLSSCSNGDYDANPVTTNSGSNPLNPGGSGGSGGGGGSATAPAARGEIRANVDGSGITITGAKWQDLAGLRLFNGAVKSNNNLVEKVLAFGISGYTGAATYTTDENSSNSCRYTFTDFGAGIIMKDYTTKVPGGTGQIIVTSDANDEMKGTFSFTGFNGSEKVIVTNGSFWVTKQ